MGLDMYSKRVKIEGVIDDLSYDADQVIDEDFFYWRKNRHLQNWMTNLYLDKGGKEEFNCVPVRLADEDLVRLAHDIILNNLDGSSGFFFGEGDFVSWCHAANLTCKNRQVKMRNSKCYMILGLRRPKAGSRVEGPESRVEGNEEEIEFIFRA